MAYVCINDEQMESDERFSIFAICLCQVLNYQNEEKDKACFTIEDFRELLDTLHIKDEKYLRNTIDYLKSIGYIVEEEDKNSYRYNFNWIKTQLKTRRFIALKNNCVDYIFEQISKEPFCVEAIEMYFRLFFYLSKLEDYMRRNNHYHYYFSITSIVRKMCYPITQDNLDMCKFLIKYFLRPEKNNPFLQVEKLGRKMKPYYVSLVESL